MFELAVNPKNILIDYNSISSNCSDKDLRSVLKKILENRKGFVLFDNESTFSFNHEIKNYLIFDQFDLYEIIDYIDLFKSENLDQYKTIMVTSDNRVIEVARNFGISSIYIKDNEEDYNSLDFKNYPDLVMNILEFKNFINDEKKGVHLYFESYLNNSEYLCAPLYKNELDYYFDNNIKIDLFLLGRYFRSNDLRSYSHLLTRAVLALKDQRDGAYNLLSPFIKYIISDLNEGFDYDYITYVPPKIGKIDRFLRLFQENNKLISDKIKPNLLVCTKDYKSQKECPTRREKAENVRGAFKLNETFEVKNKTIIIFDDVLTTGSTALECANILYSMGAKKVILMPLGVTQDSNNSMPKIPQISLNGVHYKLKFNSTSGQPFWLAGDGEYLDYKKGKKRYLKQNNADIL